MAGHDIAVVGTPHMTEQVYKFIAYRMRGNIGHTAHYVPVVHNGFGFWFYTYDDEFLHTRLAVLGIFKFYFKVTV